jgi:hypothetical protein
MPFTMIQVSYFFGYQDKNTIRANHFFCTRDMWAYYSEKMNYPLVYIDINNKQLSPFLPNDKEFYGGITSRVISKNSYFYTLSKTHWKTLDQPGGDSPNVASSLVLAISKTSQAAIWASFCYFTIQACTCNKTLLGKLVFNHRFLTSNKTLLKPC